MFLPYELDIINTYKNGCIEEGTPYVF